jgi:PAS domain S-box-containing protein
MKGSSQRRGAEAPEDGTDGILSFLSALVESSHDAIVSKTLDGTIVSWNPAAESLFGYTAAEAVGQSIRLIIPPELQAEEDYVLDQIRRGEKIDHFETVRQAKDGRRLDISLTVSPIRNSIGTVVGASKIARDITEKKTLEREREVTQQQLAEALAGRDEFIAIAAHELRNPLNVLVLLGQLMDRVPVRPGALHERKLVEKSRAQLARLSSLVDRLLDVTRIRSGSFDLYLENFELDVLIREVTDRFAVQDPAIPITLRLQPHIDGTWDRLRIDQIITNLVSNAVKYGMKRPIEIGASADGDQATITVRDQGAGISPEDLDRIFERFERVNLRSGIDGLGMGLWITKKIAEAHGGTVLAESEIGKGSAFIVRFPLRTNEGSADVSKRR